MSEQLLILRGHLGLNNKKLLYFKTLQPLPASLPPCQEFQLMGTGAKAEPPCWNSLAKAYFSTGSQAVLELGGFAYLPEDSPSLEQAQGCLDNPDTSCTSAQIRGPRLWESLGLTRLPGTGIRMEVWWC